MDNKNTLLQNNRVDELINLLENNNFKIEMINIRNGVTLRHPENKYKFYPGKIEPIRYFV